MPRRAPLPPPPEPRRAGPLRLAALAAVFAVGGALLVAPALRGPFVSDDRYYILGNPWVQRPSWPGLADVFDPRSDVTRMVANYAPVHLLVHTVQWQAFGERTLGYHVTNVVLHAVASTLFAALLCQAGLGFPAAALAATFFAVHPANVEVVAWVSQVKTLLAMVFMLAALLARGRRPVLGTAAFALALTSKAMAAIALPVAAALEWARNGEERSPLRHRLAYLAIWSAVLAAFSVVEFLAFLHANFTVPAVSDDPLVRLYTCAAIGARYLVMAATSLGVSAFHEPGPVTSPLDPWVLGGVAGALLLGARTVWALRRRRVEAAFWLMAAGSYLPVAQVFPFLYAMGDRYLYFILPGLIGGALFAGRDLLAGLVPARRRLASRAAAIAAILVCVVFAARSAQRAPLWKSETLLLADSLRHYPDGETARFFRARNAVLDGNTRSALAELRAASGGPRRGLDHVLTDPVLASLRGTPEFDALVRDLARARVAEMSRTRRLTEGNLLKLAQAYLLAEDPDGAARALAEAKARQGRYGREIEELEAQVEVLRARAARRTPGAP